MVKFALGVFPPNKLHKAAMKGLQTMFSFLLQLIWADALTNLEHSLVLQYKIP